MRSVFSLNNKIVIMLKKKKNYTGSNLILVPVNTATVVKHRSKLSFFCSIL